DVPGPVPRGYRGVAGAGRETGGCKERLLESLCVARKECRGPPRRCVGPEGSRRKPVPVRSAVSRHGDTARSARRRADSAADPAEPRRRRPDEPEVPVLPLERPDPRGVDPAPARPDGGCPGPRRGGDPDPNGRGPADARLRAACGGPRPRLPAIGP